jgi:hypothetical protein
VAEGATNDPAFAATPHDATDANVTQPNGKTGEEIQATVDERVRTFGGTLRDWPDFPHVIAQARLQPQDVTDERLSMARRHLHQQCEQVRETMKAANADPANPLPVVVIGDPELDPTLQQPSPVTPSKEKNDMTNKKSKRTTTAKTAKAAASKLSALDAAAKVLAEEGRPMSAKELIEAMAVKGYWHSPSGATPWATLSAAMGTEINKKGTASRFAKPEPGKFALRAE